MPIVRRLSRRAILQLRMLETTVRELSLPRNKALQLLRASRGATTYVAQRDQEYRIAVHRLATFCLRYGGPASPGGTVGEESAT
jgi:hypothetical protein